MRILRSSTSHQLLLIGTLLVFSFIFADAFTCPEQCSCMEIQRNRHTYNHAQCVALDGLRQLGKTSDLHSLDLSSMNLTKITNQLDKLKNLTQINLHDNRLSEINNLSTKRVRILNLSNNRITSGKLSKIPISVRHLNFTYNDITYLPLSFRKLVHLKSIELAGNPLDCTCETLEIRNWLQERHVWTDSPILCATPLEFKGRSWLQIRQTDVCESNRLEEPRALPLAHVDDENDLMLGDDPNAIVQSESSEASDTDAELGTDFLPVQDKSAKLTSADPKNVQNDAASEEMDNISDDPDYEENGSGNSLEETSTTVNHVSTDAYEGSGDDVIDEDAAKAFGLVESEPISNVTSIEEETITADLSETVTVSANLSEVVNSNENATDATDVALLPFNEPEESKIEEEIEISTTASVVEEEIVPVKAIAVDAEIIQHEGKTDNTSTSASVRREPNSTDENTQEGRGTYILLAVLGVLLVALILYVATKRSRASNKNRRNNNDAESPAEEMQSMDKNNLGKPIPSSQGEFIPLIPGKLPVDKDNYLYHAQEPLLQKLTEAENENEQSGDSVAKEDNKDDLQVPSQQQLNGTATPVQNGVHKEPVADANGNANTDFQPISPKPSRYSPVYSHDTGRIKIKLSETARPKTPILVIRSRSDAGDNKFETQVNQ